MNLKTKINKFWYKKDDPYFSKLVEEIRLTVYKGYSMVEISRALGQSMRNTYSLMRDEGIIPKLQRKRQKVHTIPERLEKTLSKCGVSFLQWCCSHNLEPEETARALLADEDQSRLSSVVAHKALRQDFPKAYGKIMASEADYSSSFRPKLDELRTDYTITIVLNPETNGFIAYIHELPECRVEAATRIDSFFMLQSRYVCYSCIHKLQMLPDRSVSAQNVW